MSVDEMFARLCRVGYERQGDDAARSRLEIAKSFMLNYPSLMRLRRSTGCIGENARKYYNLRLNAVNDGDAEKPR